jgi:hypothetical protein
VPVQGRTSISVRDMGGLATNAQVLCRRRHVVQASCVLMTFLGPVACSSVLGVGNRKVDTVVAVSGEAQLNSYPSTQGVIATIPVTIQNTGANSVWYSLCGNALERRNGKNWEEVWAQLCSDATLHQAAGVPPQGTEIAPGEQFSTEIRVAAWLGQGWTEPLSGQYRFKAGLFDESGPLAVEARTSSAFQFQIQVQDQRTP